MSAREVARLRERLRQAEAVIVERGKQIAELAEAVIVERDKLAELTAAHPLVEGMVYQAQIEEHEGGTVIAATLVDAVPRVLVRDMQGQEWWVKREALSPMVDAEACR